MSMATENLERDVEATRSRVEQTVGAIKDKMSVGQIIDDVTHYAARHGGSDIAASLGRQIKDNPLPIALVGVGLAWLMLGRGARPDSAHDNISGNYAGDWGRSGDGNGLGEKVRGAAHAASSAVHSAAAGVSSAMHGVSSAVRSAGDAADRVGHGAESVAEAGREGLHEASQYGRAAVGYGERTAKTVTDFFRDEPLFLGAVGLAIGATVAALLPATEVEDNLFGEARDRVAKDAERVASEQFERVKDTALDTYETVKSEAEERLHSLAESARGDASSQRDNRAF